MKMIYEGEVLKYEDIRNGTTYKFSNEDGSGFVMLHRMDEDWKMDVCLIDDDMCKCEEQDIDEVEKFVEYLFNQSNLRLLFLFE